MGYGIFLDEISRVFFVGQRAEPFNASMLPFDLLNSLLKTIEFEHVEVAASEKLCGECCICLESFHSRSEAVLTKCKHAFHPVCLTRSLCSVGAGSSCPLCRAPFDELLPDGHDGAVIRFLHMVGSSMDEIEGCYRNCLLYVEAQSKLLEAFQQTSLACASGGRLGPRVAALLRPVQLPGQPVAGPFSSFRCVHWSKQHACLY